MGRKVVKVAKPLPIRAADLDFSAEMFLAELDSKKASLEKSRADNVRPPPQQEQPSSSTSSSSSSVSTPSPSPSEATVEANPITFEEGDLVRVLKRSGPGPVKQHGVGRIVGPSEIPGHFVVKFSLGSRDKRVPVSSIVPHNLFDDSAMIEAVKKESMGETCGAHPPKTREERAEEESEAREEKEQDKLEETMLENCWVRRSFRNSGSQQLTHPKVVKLLERLRKNDPNDLELEVLRLKNHIDADSNKHVVIEVLRALEKNTVVQALYIQNMEEGMDDETLEKLVEMLKVNNTIWALNVGENFGISRAGWVAFAEGLKDTHITHMYAGSETTVYGQLKVTMRNVIRDNRVKHKRHNDPNNLRVIRQIGQMWWNPKNSQRLTTFLTEDEREEVASKVAPLVGRRVFIEYNTSWREGRITKFNEMRGQHLVAWDDWVNKTQEEIAKMPVDARGAWLTLKNHRHLLSDRIVWSKRPVVVDGVEVVPEETKTKKRKSTSSESSRKKKKKKTVVKTNTVKSMCSPLLSALRALPAAKDFINPVDWRSRGLEDYPEIVKQPMDLKTVRLKLNRDEYDTVDSFAADVRLVFNNCLLYNREEEEDPAYPIRKWATELLEMFESQLTALKESQQGEQAIDQDQTMEEEEEKEEKVENADGQGEGWEPVHAYKHNETMPLELQIEEQDKETMVNFLRSPRDWFWLREDEFREWDQMTPEEMKSIPNDLFSLAQAEQRVFLSSLS